MCFMKRPASDEAHNNHSEDSESEESQNLAMEAKFGTEKESEYSDNEAHDENVERYM